MQIGKLLGAHVTGLASAKNLDFVTGLGADEALDHRSVGPSDLGDFDVIMDTVGTQHPEFRRVLAPRGRMVAVALDMDRIGASVGYLLRSTVHGSRRVRFFSGDPRTPLLADLTRHAESGAIRPVVDTVRPLAEIAEAHRALEAGGVRGKHVIQVAREAVNEPLA